VHGEGTDIDGFVKPTLDGVKSYGDMRNVKNGSKQISPKPRGKPSTTTRFA
jgi:hypothetical protein